MGREEGGREEVFYSTAYYTGVFSHLMLYLVPCSYYAYYTYTRNMQSALQAEFISKGKCRLKRESLETGEKMHK